jgi:hypothetical protein
MTAGEVVVARHKHVKEVAGKQAQATTNTPSDLDKDLYSHKQARTYNLF